MKYLEANKSLIILLGVLLCVLTSCSDNDQPDAEVLGTARLGSIVQIETIESGFYNLNDLENSNVSFTLGVDGVQPTQIKVYKQLNNGPKILVGEYSNFPVEVDLPALEAVAGTSKTAEELEAGDFFTFSFESIQDDGFTTSSGTVLNANVACVSDIGGTYDVVTTWTDYYGDPGENTFTETLAAGSVAGQYVISDLSGGMEPIVWGNPKVEATISDVCNTISLVSADYSYAYMINSGQVNDDGTIKIVWENEYGENGVNVYTPQ